MSFIERWFTSSGYSGRGDPWPERPRVATDALRDWWVADCWFHKTSALAEAHYDALVKWVAEQPPDSLAYLSWAPYTKLRIDLSCLKEPATPQVEKRYGNPWSRYYTLALCYAQAEHQDVEQYLSVWRQSPEYEAVRQAAESTKNGWSGQAVRVTPRWYHEMTLKAAGSQWLGYHGFEEYKAADHG